MRRALALVLLAFAACAHHTPTPTPAFAPTPSAPAPAPAPVSAPALASAPAPPPPGVRQIGRCDDPKGPHRFTIAHFNDLQARYSDRIAGKSRYAYLAGYLQKLKQEQPNTLVLDGGDDYEKGSLADLRSNGEVTRQIVQALPIDARVIGNHDFAYGEAAVLRDVTLSSHPVLSANVHRGEDTGPFVPYVRIDVGCVKVGIVGLTTGSYDAADNPTRDPYFGTFHWSDAYYQAIDEQVRAHRKEVDVMIALTHIGQYYDTDLAKAHGGVDFFVGGHSEDLLADLEGARRKDKTHAYVMQVGRYAKYVGRADVVVRALSNGLPWATLERYAVVPIDEKMPASQDMHDLVERLEKGVTPDLHGAIATLPQAIDVKQMGDLVRRAAQERWGADALVLASDVFFDGLPQGPITLQRLYETAFVQKEPSGTTGFTSLYLMTLTGDELRTMKGTARAPYVVYAPDALVPSKKYKVAIEKRAMSFPQLAWSPPPKALPPARFAGEIIDLLESFARARLAAGKSLIAP